MLIPVGHTEIRWNSRRNIATYDSQSIEKNFQKYFYLLIMRCARPQRDEVPFDKCHAFRAENSEIEVWTSDSEQRR